MSTDELREFIKSAWRRRAEALTALDALTAEVERLGEALDAIHDYHCGCAAPGSAHVCVCKPLDEFKVLRPSISHLSPSEEQS